MGGMRESAARAAIADVEQVLSRPQGLDLPTANRCAADLATVAEPLYENLEASPPDPGPTARDLRSLTSLGHRLREQILAMRFQTLDRIGACLVELREVAGVEALLPAASEAMAAACDFDRATISSVDGSAWRAEATWIAPGHDPALASQVREYLKGRWTPLQAGVLEGELVRRREPGIVRAQDKHADSALIAVSGSREYVAAPLVAEGRVIGILQADCFCSGRELSGLDCDNLSSFALGFGLVFERTALLERLEDQRERIREVFETADRELARIADSEATLSRSRPASAPTSAGPRAAPMIPIDQLLTPRERQVAELMSSGARNREIADSLVVSEETVKTHVRSISRKLRASGRADAVARYLQLRMRWGD